MRGTIAEIPIVRKIAAVAFGRGSESDLRAAFLKSNVVGIVAVGKGVDPVDRCRGTCALSVDTGGILETATGRTAVATGSSLWDGGSAAVPARNCQPKPGIGDDHRSVFADPCRPL